jgi:3-hydroxyacyl-CoA dehydrogenase
MYKNRNNDIGVAVIGGGNIGTQFACKCASKGYRVNVYSSKPELYDGLLEIIDEDNKITVGKLNKVMLLEIAKLFS